MQHSACGTSLCGVERGVMCFQRLHCFISTVLQCGSLGAIYVLERGLERCDGSEHPCDGL